MPFQDHLFDGGFMMHVGMNRAVEVLALGAEKRAAREAAKAKKAEEKAVYGSAGHGVHVPGPGSGRLS